jgi:dTMP kinase
MTYGKFVSFEGIEGCGKTTQIALLSDYLKKHSIAHTITREPGGTAVGEGIRKILLDSETIHLTPASELLLFYASRSQNIQEKIKPALERNEIVICDRYYHASMAYQGYGRGLPLDFIQKLTNLVCDPFRPDVTFLLDIEPALGLARARARNHSRPDNEGRFEAEDLDFYNRVRDGYLELASGDERIQLIYADRPIEAVHRHILTLMGLE